MSVRRTSFGDAGDLRLSAVMEMGDARQVWRTHGKASRNVRQGVRFAMEPASRGVEGNVDGVDEPVESLA